MLDDCTSAVVCLVLVLREVALVVAGCDEALDVSATKLFVFVKDSAVLVLSLNMEGVAVVFGVVVGAVVVEPPSVLILWQSCWGPTPARKATTKFCP